MKQNENLGEPLSINETSAGKDTKDGQVREDFREQICIDFVQRGEGGGVEPTESKLVEALFLFVHVC